MNRPATIAYARRSRIPGGLPLVMTALVVAFGMHGAHANPGTFASGLATDQRGATTSTLPAERRQVVLVETADVALSRRDYAMAQKCGTELLAIAANPVSDSHPGYALHEGHRILGHVALAEGDIQSAKAHLLDAGRTSGSPSLNTFGPSMSLANDLLARGESEVVIEYLQLCLRFWTRHRDRVNTWIAQIRSGQRPVLDPFKPHHGDGS